MLDALIFDQTYLSCYFGLIVAYIKYCNCLQLNLHGFIKNAKSENATFKTMYTVLPYLRDSFSDVVYVFLPTVSIYIFTGSSGNIKPFTK